MNTKYNFNNRKLKASKFDELDTNPSHYKDDSFTHSRSKMSVLRRLQNVALGVKKKDGY